MAGCVIVVWTGVMLTSFKVGGIWGTGGMGKEKKDENELGVSVCSDCSRKLVEVTLFSIHPDFALLQYSSTSVIIT